MEKNDLLTNIELKLDDQEIIIIIIITDLFDSRDHQKGHEKLKGPQGMKELKLLTDSQQQLMNKTVAQGAIHKLLKWPKSKEIEFYMSFAHFIRNLD